MIPTKDNLLTERLPIVTILLVLANFLMYFVFQRGGILTGPNLADIVGYGAIPYEFTHWGQHCELVGQNITCGNNSGVLTKQVPTLLTGLTSMFMHANIIHLLGNMIFLIIFGRNVEDSMGRVRFLLFYLAGGAAALITQLVINNNSELPAVGASGAIAAVLGAYALLYPTARIGTLILIVFLFTAIELPALVVLGLWFLEQVAFAYLEYTQPAGNAGSGVAYWAHIGGFTFGLLAIKLLAKEDIVLRKQDRLAERQARRRKSENVDAFAA